MDVDNQWASGPVVLLSCQVRFLFPPLEMRSPMLLYLKHQKGFIHERYLCRGELRLNEP
jgi:hypothetical protein